MRRGGEPTPSDVASSDDPRPLSGLLSSEHPLTEAMSLPVDSCISLLSAADVFCGQKDIYLYYVTCASRTVITFTQYLHNGHD